MNRRKFSTEIIFALSPGMLAALGSAAHAASLQDLTEKEASQGLKAALKKGATVAVGLLGQTDGFLGNEKVRIPLPGFLEDAAKLLRKLGQGKRVDELVTGMNRAAEAAVPQAKELLVSAVSSMNVSDAKNILTGGDTSVTTFFSEKTRSPLFTRFLPIVTQSIEQIGLVEKYNQVAGKAAGFGLVKKDDAKLQDYVTNKTLDGLYTMIAEEERKIRSNPIGAGSALLQKVFGALK